MIALEGREAPGAEIPGSAGLRPAEAAVEVLVVAGGFGRVGFDILSKRTFAELCYSLI